MDEVEEALRVRQIESHPERRVWRLENGAGDTVAIVTTTGSPSEASDIVVDVAPSLVVSRAQAQQVVRAISQLSDTASLSHVSMQILDPLVRYEARRAGSSGALRGPLVFASLDCSRGGDTRSHDELLTELQGFLPFVEVELRHRRIRDYEIAARSHDGGDAIRVRIENRPAMMVEQVAAVIDTALVIKRRLGAIAASVRRLDFDDGGFGRQAGRRWAGLAQVGAGVAWLSPHLAFVDAFVETRRHQFSTGGPPRKSAPVPPPHAEIDGVAAHEFWHLIDRQVIGSGRSYVRFNRALGEALGVATLEHALRGAEPGAAPEWRDAHERLMREVSPYATTNPREATAEMFKLWWCSDGQPTGIVGVFGNLVEQSVSER